MPKISNLKAFIVERFSRLHDIYSYVNALVFCYRIECMSMSSNLPNMLKAEVLKAT